MKVIAIYAVEEEAVKLSFQDATIRYVCSGMGKTHAAERLAKAIEENRPDWVVNFGTAGTSRHQVGDIVICNQFILRDMNTSDHHKIIHRTLFPPLQGIVMSGKVKTDGTCSTSNSFVTEASDVEGDVVDMEAYDEALLCKESGIPFVAVKYVTDIIGQNSLAIWKDKLAEARRALTVFFSDVTQTTTD